MRISIIAYSLFPIILCLSCQDKEQNSVPSDVVTEVNPRNSDRPTIELDDEPKVKVRPVSVLFTGRLKRHLEKMASATPGEPFYKSYREFIQDYPSFDKPQDPFSYLLSSILFLNKRDGNVDTWALEPAKLYLQIYKLASEIDVEDGNNIIRERLASAVLGYDSTGHESYIRKAFEQVQIELEDVTTR